jgi:colanic acid biosynthesis glycosyl transferase WcaI
MPKKPSILILARHYPPSKSMAARLTRDLALDLIADGWDVRVVTTGNVKHPMVQTDMGVEIIRVPTFVKKNYMGHLNAWFAIYNMARKLPRHDVVLSISDSPFLAIAGARIAAQKSSSHIHWCHEILPELWPIVGYKLPSSILSYLDKHMMKSLRASNHVIVSGRCMKDHLIYRGLDQQQVSIIPPWENADPGGAVKDDMLEEQPACRYTDPTMLFRVMYTGSISGATPVSPLLDAALSIVKEFNDIEFVFVGDGPAFEKIASLKARHGLDRIKLLPLPPISHAANMMASGDVHVVTLKDEAAGLIVPTSFYTAMAAHRPVIVMANDHNEMAKFLAEYPFGSVVPLGDAAALRDMILKFRHDRHEWFNAHQAAIAAHKKYNHETARTEWLRLIKSSFRPLD